MKNTVNVIRWVGVTTFGIIAVYALFQSAPEGKAPLSFRRTE